MFRNHSFKLDLSYVGAEVLSNVLVTDEHGSICVVSKPVSEINKDIPEPSDYSLEALINANIPLNVVPTNIDDVSSSENIEHFVNSNLKDNDNEN